MIHEYYDPAQLGEVTDPPTLCQRCAARRGWGHSAIAQRADVWAICDDCGCSQDDEEGDDAV